MESVCFASIWDERQIYIKKGVLESQMLLCFKIQSKAAAVEEEGAIFA